MSGERKNSTDCGIAVPLAVDAVQNPNNSHEAGDLSCLL